MDACPDDGQTPSPHNSNPHRPLRPIKGATDWWLTTDGTTAGACYGPFVCADSAIHFRDQMAGRWDAANAHRADVAQAKRELAGSELARAVSAFTADLQGAIGRSGGMCGAVELLMVHRNLCAAVNHYRKEVANA